MIPTLTLREASASDAPILVQLIRTAFEEYRGVLDPPSGAADISLARMQDLLQAGDFVIAYRAGDPVGCVFYQEYEDHVYLGRLAVLPGFRQQGIGRALVEYVEARARALNRPSVRLGVRVALPHLQRWYQRMGYHLIEERSHEGYATPTFMLLEKRL